MNRTIALIGNPNCGKSTLFNLLTNSYQKTGNWTGVTTKPKISPYKNNKLISIIDLPGIYSLQAKSDDERAVLNFLKNSPPQAIINIIDGTNLERNLYLTLELSNLNIPVVVAVNMLDQLNSNNIIFNQKGLEKLLGVPVVPISALKGQNIDRLIKVALTNKLVLKRQNLGYYKGENLAQKRYSFIEENINKIIQTKRTKEEQITQKIDNVIMHKFWGLPIFFCVLTFVYYLSISIGGFLGGFIINAFNNASNYIKICLINCATKDYFIGLIGAIIEGLGLVFALLPQILILYSLLAILELSGYASRIAFILDRFFSTFGLSGKSLIPMMVSCGCTVAGLTATRTIESKSERRMSIFLTAFMPCGAKMAVFGHFAHTLFGGNAFVASSMYFVSVLCVAVFGKILKKFKCFNQQDGGFVLEIPLLKIPSIKDIFYVLIEKVNDFLTKVGAIVISLSVALWFLKSFGVSGYVGGQIQQSFLYFVGDKLKYVFYPLGFGSWQVSIAVICGLFAKEGIVECLGIVALDLASLFDNTFSAYAFMVFVLLSPPCMASLITAKRELVNKKWFLFMITFQFLSGYLLAFIINLLGILFKYQFGLLLICITAIIMLLILILKKVKFTKKEQVGVKRW